VYPMPRDPTLGEIRELASGNALSHRTKCATLATVQKLFVRALTVSDHEISFVCPFCYMQYRGDGTPVKGARRAVHKVANTVPPRMFDSGPARLEYCVPDCCPLQAIPAIDVVIMDAGGGGGGGGRVRREFFVAVFPDTPRVPWFAPRA
jgi:hypothetical protein